MKLSVQIFVSKSIQAEKKSQANSYLRSVEAFGPFKRSGPNWIRSALDTVVKRAETAKRHATLKERSPTHNNFFNSAAQLVKKAMDGVRRKRDMAESTKAKHAMAARDLASRLANGFTDMHKKSFSIRNLIPELKNHQEAKREENRKQLRAAAYEIKKAVGAMKKRDDTTAGQQIRIPQTIHDSMRMTPQVFCRVWPLCFDGYSSQFRPVSSDCMTACLIRFFCRCCHGANVLSVNQSSRWANSLAGKSVKQTRFLPGVLGAHRNTRIIPGVIEKAKRFLPGITGRARGLHQKYTRFIGLGHQATKSYGRRESSDAWNADDDLDWKRAVRRALQEKAAGISEPAKRNAFLRGYRAESSQV